MAREHPLDGIKLMTSPLRLLILRLLPGFALRRQSTSEQEQQCQSDCARSSVWSGSDGSHDRVLVVGEVGVGKKEELCFVPSNLCGTRVSPCC